jgi:ribosomal protein S12 methylthiotransferase
MQKKIYVSTLGCDKNTADTSALKGMMAERGLSLTDNLDVADWAVINTCGFILAAKEESIQAILELVAAKEDNKGLKVIVHGCLVQKYEEELRESIPEVDAFFGVYSLQEILDYIDSIEDDRSEMNKHEHLQSDERYPRSVDGRTAYLKIADGCDTCCTYCAIPSIKGPFISREPAILLQEARNLVEQGSQELILVAQDTTAYGKDLAGDTNLSSLLKELCLIDDLHWIRILYAYPDAIDIELIDTINSEDKICNYLDVPLQHANDAILKRMGRKQSRKQMLELISMIRTHCPDVTLRSTFITGFPQESESEFEDMLNFIQKVKLNWVGAFTYSQEEGTSAARMTGQVDEGIKGDRYNRLMRLQQGETASWLKQWLGKTVEVLIEEKSSEQSYVGRTRFMAPDVDGIISFTAKREVVIGDFVLVRVTESTEYDLMGELEDEYIK